MKEAIVVKAIGCKKCESLLNKISGIKLKYEVNVFTEGTGTGDKIIEDFNIQHFPTTIFFNDDNEVELVSGSMLESYKKLTGDI